MKITKTTYLLFAILLLGAGLRLIGIGNPLTGHHTWRQTETAAVARNFVEERFNILYPKIDWRGTTSGEVECEFPIYQFTVASLYKVFGVKEVAGRLLSITFSLAAILGTFFLSKRAGGSSVGLWSAFFMAILPLPAFFGRAVMPESLLLASCVYAVLFFDQWADSGSRRTLALSALCLTIACLIKPPTLYLGLPLAFLAIHKHKFKALARPELWVYAIAIFAALVAWYSHAYKLQQSTGLSFGIWEYGTDKWGNWDLVLSWAFWERILLGRIPQILLAYLGLPLLIIGIVRPSRSEKEKLFGLWLLGTLVFIVIVAQGVFVHDYYLLPASVPAAYFLGKAAAWGMSRSRPVSKWVRIGIAICIIGTLSLSIARQYRWIRREVPTRTPAFQLAKAATHLISTDSLVVTVDTGNPHPMILYYSHTKGWNCSPHTLSEEWLNARSREGAKYILGVHKDFEDVGATHNLTRMLTRHEIVTNNGSFFVVTTEKKQPAPKPPMSSTNLN